MKNGTSSKETKRECLEVARNMQIQRGVEKGERRKEKGEKIK